MILVIYNFTFGTEKMYIWIKSSNIEPSKIILQVRHSSEVTAVANSRSHWLFERQRSLFLTLSLTNEVFTICFEYEFLELNITILSLKLRGVNNLLQFEDNFLYHD
jgi:hypothetical protein